MINKINFLLTNKDKKTLFILLIMSIILSIIETIGITAIMPFISVASNPELILENKYYKYVYDFFNLTSKSTFILYFGLSLIAFYLFRAFYIVFNGYMVNKFSMEKYMIFTNKIFKNYLNMPYSKFVTQNTGTLSKVLTSESYQLAFVIQNILIFMSEVLVIMLLYILLLLVDIQMTILLTTILGVKIFLLKITVSKKIKKKGDKRAYIQEGFYKTINETFGNFKIIKFISNQSQIINKFEKTSESFGRIFISNNTLQLVPKNVLEAVGFSILMGVVIYIVLYSNEPTSLIPIISMYALALYRILPAITKILNSYNNIIFHSASLEIVYNDIKNSYEEENNENLDFEKLVSARNITFSYNGNTNIINNLSVDIKKGTKIAFVGESGSGKSTLVDIICGIYKPNEGEIYIDNQKLTNKNIVSWRKKIGYIPQSIYLFDGTIKDNIVFGREYSESKLINVLKQANIYDVIMQKEGLDTLVGEGGIQLSGGQKQRIGIARALYGNPQILVLDEATSALDTATETAIMDEIYKVSSDKTLLIIAHRLSTIERCEVKIDLNKCALQDIQTKKDNILIKK